MPRSTMPKLRTGTPASGPDAADARQIVAGAIGVGITLVATAAARSRVHATSTRRGRRCPIRIGFLLFLLDMVSERRPWLYSRSCGGGVWGGGAGPPPPPPPPKPVTRPQTPPLGHF